MSTVTLKVVVGEDLTIHLPPDAGIAPGAAEITVCWADDEPEQEPNGAEEAMTFAELMQWAAAEAERIGRETGEHLPADLADRHDYYKKYPPR